MSAAVKTQTEAQARAANAKEWIRSLTDYELHSIADNDHRTRLDRELAMVEIGRRYSIRELVEAA